MNHQRAVASLKFGSLVRIYGLLAPLEGLNGKTGRIKMEELNGRVYVKVGGLDSDSDSGSHSPATYLELRIMRCSLSSEEGMRVIEVGEGGLIGHFQADVEQEPLPLV